MRIQLTTNFGCANGVVSYQWFDTIMDAQDYCESVIKTYWSANTHNEAILDIQSANVKQLTNIMTNARFFKFEWV